MTGLRYFPLTTDRFQHQFGVRAIKSHESIVEQTDSFDDQIKLKRQLLLTDRENHCQSLPLSEPAQREASSLLIGKPCLLIDAATGLQEDLVVLSGDVDAGHPIIAGVVCFPSGWTIAEKVGQPIDRVHRPVPEYAEVMSQATNQLMQKLRPDRPVWRTNWGVRPSGQLDQSPKQMDRIRKSADQLTAANAGTECYFRVERQTLSRLPTTNAILFTIHTHQCRLSELNPEQQINLLGVLKTCPKETLRYKGIEPFVSEVCDFLSRSCV